MQTLAGRLTNAAIPDRMNVAGAQEPDGFETTNDRSTLGNHARFSCLCFLSRLVIRIQRRDGIQGGPPMTDLTHKFNNAAMHTTTSSRCLHDTMLEPSMHNRNCSPATDLLSSSNRLRKRRSYSSFLSLIAVSDVMSWAAQLHTHGLNE